MTKTFLYGLVVAIQPTRGAAILTIELDAPTKPVTRFEGGRERAGVVRKLAPLVYLTLSRRTWTTLKEQRGADEILVKRVAIDQLPGRFAFTSAPDSNTPVEWWPALRATRTPPFPSLAWSELAERTSGGKVR